MRVCTKTDISCITIEDYTKIWRVKKGLSQLLHSNDGGVRLWILLQDMRV